MSITLAAESSIIDGARSYAKRSGMTLEDLLLDYIKEVSRREHDRHQQAAREMYDYLMAQKGTLLNGSVFSREEANAR